MHKNPQALCVCNFSNIVYQLFAHICVTISLLCFHLLTLFFMNSVSTLFMLSIHYIEQNFFFLVYLPKYPAVLNSLFAADVQHSFLTLLRLMAS